MANTKKWIIESSASWCIPTPSSGVGDASNISIDVSANTTGVRRIATLTVRLTDSGSTSKIKITQEG